MVTWCCWSCCGVAGSLVSWLCCGGDLVMCSLAVCGLVDGDVFLGLV